LGSPEKIFCHDAVRVTARSQISGIPGIHAHHSNPILITTTVTTVSAIAASH
jgi:hypothetical protein